MHTFIYFFARNAGDTHALIMAMATSNPQRVQQRCVAWLQGRNSVMIWTLLQQMGVTYV